MIAGANEVDHRLLEDTLRSVIVARPAPEQIGQEHLCLDAGYDNETGHNVAGQHGYVAHIRPARSQQPHLPPDLPRGRKYKPRRWVVERTLSWLNRCRAILVRWDKKAENYLGLLKLACALLWFRRWFKLAF